MRRKVSLVLLACAVAFTALVARPASVAAVDGAVGATDPDLEKKGYLNDDHEVLDENGNIIQNIAGDGGTEIGVFVNAEGGEDITFSIHIDWGEMKFKYNFGTTWDPKTHSYHGATKSGWMKSYADGTNNKIEVFNNSNYPVHAEFTYKHVATDIFNRAAGGTDAVDGGFALDNADLLAHWDEIRGSADLHDPVKTVPYKVEGKTDVKLDMCTDALLPGDIAYSYEDKDEPNNIIHFDEVYFALFGLPDRNISVGTGGTFEQAGSITVHIKPAEPAEVKIYQLE